MLYSAEGCDVVRDDIYPGDCISLNHADISVAVCVEFIYAVGLEIGIGELDCVTGHKLQVLVNRRTHPLEGVPLHLVGVGDFVFSILSAAVIERESVLFFIFRRGDNDIEPRRIVSVYRSEAFGGSHAYLRFSTKHLRDNRFLVAVHHNFHLAGDRSAVVTPQHYSFDARLGYAKDEASAEVAETHRQAEGTSDADVLRLSPAVVAGLLAALDGGHHRRSSVDAAGCRVVGEDAPELGGVGALGGAGHNLDISGEGGLLYIVGVGGYEEASAVLSWPVEQADAVVRRPVELLVDEGCLGSGLSAFVIECGGEYDLLESVFPVTAGKSVTGDVCCTAS